MPSTCAKINTPNAADESGDATTISAVHPDVIQTHILTRLDGPALASVASACSEFHALSALDHLWANICHYTWPSTKAPRVSHIIATFPGASHSFFSDSFPVALAAAHGSCTDGAAPELISAVDLFHRQELVLSRMVETETESGWFRCSPFRVDLLEPKEAVPSVMKYPRSEEACDGLGEKLTLSWIVIDPKGKRAMNVSSGKPVSVRRHWLSGEVQMRFASLIDGGEKGSATEGVLCSMTVTCGGEMQVREVCLHMEDMDGMQLNGRDSLKILQRALEGKRGKLKNEKAGRHRYGEFINRKEERKEKKVKAERRLDMFCVAFLVLSFAALSVLFLF
ncbi:probable F-box protein At2g36090 [Abrus precatorius]|uniref:Probable F-box protein At2g36090 n=1 Tax=Abrus precatorius TaxID=3816 RepID=A0A8B8L128_ABRPR|nr:probable F-box protein At2g36090 [Abrus precatorius]